MVLKEYRSSPVGAAPGTMHVHSETGQLPLYMLDGICEELERSATL